MNIQIDLAIEIYILPKNLSTDYFGKEMLKYLAGSCKVISSFSKQRLFKSPSYDINTPIFVRISF